MAGNEWKYIKECIDTGWISSAGKFVDAFADKFTTYLGGPRAVPVVNGTAALHVSLIALGLKPDEEVLIPTLTFVATANVVVYCNAHPVFMDVEGGTLGLDPQKVESFLAQECGWKDGCLTNRTTGRRVSGIIPVHLYGHPANMSPILNLADKYGLFVLEDATEALGSRYRGRPAGTLGQIGAFSFNGNKLITTGGGGMVVTEDAQLADRIEHLTTQAKASGSEYYHTEIGYNYRLTNIQAAMGLAQLEKVDEFVSRRRAIAHYYQKQLRDVAGITVGTAAEWAWSNYWLSWIMVEKEYGKPKDELLGMLNDRDIEARAFFVPLHMLPPYRSYQSYQIENALNAYEKGINLPSHTSLKEGDLGIVVDTIKGLAQDKRGDN
jgi:perosamine synthetase